ncbi:MAG TPA: IS200/IS605 family transposase [Chryseosolibacter sp.]
MAQSLVKNYLHIIFSTKKRQSLVDEHIEKDLFNYLGGICNGLESYPLKIGGYRDHVHILCLLSKKIALIKFMQELKAQSSKWIKPMDGRYKNFFWQDGYGAFSVAPSEIESVKRYIENQHEHHKKKTFQEEYREFLNLYDVDYDERYVWD